MDIYSKTQKASCVKENINNSHKDFHSGPQYPLLAFPINHSGKNPKENIHIAQDCAAFFVDKANGQKDSKSDKINPENDRERRPGDDLPVITNIRRNTMKFTPDSKFMILCSRLVELTKINLLWLLCCLPVFTAGAATTAMITCLYAFRAEENCGSRVFFAAFRRCFKRATLLWLLIGFFAAMLVLDYVIVAYLTFPGRMAVIVLIFFLLFALILVSGLVFPLLSQFPGRIKETVVNAVLLSLAHLPKMLMVTAMNLLPVLLALLLPQVFLLLGFVWLVCGFALMGWYDITVIEKIFAPYRVKEA